MKPSGLWNVSVKASPDADDAVAEWLETTFGQPASSFTDAESRQATVSVYLRDRPDWSAARRRELAVSLERMGYGRMHTGYDSLSLTRIPQKDWAESWKLHFKPSSSSSSHSVTRGGFGSTGAGHGPGE